MKFHQASFSKYKRVAMGERLVFLPIPASADHPERTIAIGIELEDGTAIFVGGRTRADLEEVLEAADHVAMSVAN